MYFKELKSMARLAVSTPFDEDSFLQTVASSAFVVTAITVLCALFRFPGGGAPPNTHRLQNIRFKLIPADATDPAPLRRTAARPPDARVRVRPPRRRAGARRHGVGQRRLSSHHRSLQPHHPRISEAESSRPPFPSPAAKGCCWGRRSWWWWGVGGEGSRTGRRDVMRD